MDGVLLLHKPAGLTSHNCVQKIRQLFRTKKVGHTGTLDPDVSGVLPICIGKATKVAQYLMSEDKEYVAEVTLGIATETEDASGKVVAQKKVIHPPSRPEVERVLKNLLGKIVQVPPMYSAVKVNGKKLYEYAREGKMVNRPKRIVTIFDICLRSNIKHEGNTASFSIQVSCSKGTYIRTLAVMIGEQLGYPAHMSDLVRIRSGRFHLHDCITFQTVEQFLENGEFPKGFLTIDNVLNHLPKWTINDTLARKVRNGSVLTMPEHLSFIDKDEIIAVWHNQHIIALYQKHPLKANMIKPVKVMKQDE